MDEPIKILSVDDEEELEKLLRQYFRRQIRSGHFEFFFAHDGFEALSVLEEHPDIKIVLSDINMPEMDGLMLLSKLNEKQDPALRCIMVSAYNNIENIREAMNQGAFDFATKPIDLDDLNKTIEKAIKQIDFVCESRREHVQLESLKTEIQLAGKIQQAILPHVSSPFPEHSGKMDVAALMEAAKDVGGDFYDFFRFDDHTICFTIADVCGKGIPAAFYMAVSRTMVHSAGMKEASPAKCIAHANDMLSEDSTHDMFVTMLYGTYNVDTGQVKLCNAGHNLPFVIHSDGTTEELSMPTNMVAGALEDQTFDEMTLQLEKGDTLYMFTDGVTETMNKERELFGKDRLKAVLSSHPADGSKEIIQHVRETVDGFADGAEQNDDITMLVIKRLS